jgi:hypothetical protein
MEITRTLAKPHTYLVEALFAHKSRVSKVFRDVLGIHEINHIAITRIDRQGNILVFSSTPAMEFNLFTSKLWKFDKTFHHEWYRQCAQASWQSLYSPQRYDELYYLRQIRHQLPLGKSLAAVSGEFHYIYSVASQRSCLLTQELFSTHQDSIYKIGQYCTNLLNPLFILIDQPMLTNMEEIYPL